MFKISATAEYALLMVQYLRKNPQPHTLSEIASALKVPETCLRKVTGPLERAGITISKKGRSGGIELVNKAFSVGEILQAVGEDFSIAHCSGACNKSAFCELSSLFRNLERGFKSILTLTKI